MQSDAQFPLTLTLSPGEREQLSSALEYSLNSERFPALPRVLPAPEPGGDRDGPRGATCWKLRGPRGAAQRRSTALAWHARSHKLRWISSRKAASLSGVAAICSMLPVAINRQCIL